MTENWPSTPLELEVCSWGCHMLHPHAKSQYFCSLVLKGPLKLLGDLLNGRAHIPYSCRIETPYSFPIVSTFQADSWGSNNTNQHPISAGDNRRRVNCLVLSCSWRNRSLVCGEKGHVLLGYTILEHKLIVMGYTILWDIMGNGIFIFILGNRFAVAGFFGDDQGVISIKQFLEIHAFESVLIL